MGKQTKKSDVELIQFGREILDLEAKAVLAVQESLDQNFVEAVKLILNMPETGRVVVSGMGKAGFIAMKISATLASTGVPSFFLHPAEAIHGDLGRYSKGDIALILSKSGETEEVLRMLGPIKRMGCAIISITGNPKSKLATHSDTVLCIGDCSEAGPLGLAPTSSAMAMLALGDALSMAILSEQDFSREQFARFHPGGSLGKQLMLVSEIMRKGDENAVVSKDTITREVLRIITATKGRPGAASVVDEEGRLCGIFTDGDLRRYLQQGSSFLELPIFEVMTKNPKTISPDTLVQEALGIMSKHKIDQLIVVDDTNVPVGLLDVQDLVDVNI